MRLNRSRASQNIDDRRSLGRQVGRRSIGIGTIVLALIAVYFGVDPNVVLQMEDQVAPTAQVEGQRGAPTDAQGQFVARILGETEDVWNQVFLEQTTGQYRAPTLVLFRGATPTACGTGQSAMGPFYCPGDQKVYIDLSFFDEMEQQLNAPGDFAQAYVLAHEIGHHVQNQLGAMQRAEQMRGSQQGGNAASVRLELQADCYAGVWAHHANAQREILEPGDMQEALDAAAAVGDDTLQRRSQGYVVPDSFTHGSSAQRVSWFKRGFDSGMLRACDTFAG